MTGQLQAKWKFRRLLLPFLAAAALAGTAAAPLAAFGYPPYWVDVELEKVLPAYDGDYIYQAIAGETQYSANWARLAFDVFLQNDESFQVTVDHAVLQFDSPAIPSIVLDSGLQMWCTGNDEMMVGGGNLVMQPGDHCRLGLTPDPVIGAPPPGRLSISVYYVGIYTPTSTLEHDLRPYRNSTTSGAYRFPAHAEDLPAGQFWSGRPALSGDHHRFTSRTSNDEVFAHDLGVIRRDPVAGWVDYEVPAPGELSPNDANDDFLCWEMPVYAMADGIVLDFEQAQNDHAPTSPAPSVPANFFLIQHGEETVWYGHLRKNSLNPLLTSNGAVVKEGDFLGRVGNTGHSSKPHLHVDLVRGDDPVPLQFNDAFLVERDTAFVTTPPGNSPWRGLQNQGLSPSLTAIWPSGLRRRGEATDVAITDVALANPNTSRTVSAARTATGNLRVSLWRTDSSGEAALLDTETGGGVDKVALATPYATSHAGLAMITDDGNLKLAAFEVAGNDLTRTANYSSYPALDVAATPSRFTTGGLVTAVRTQNGNLKVIAWDIDAAGGEIARRGEDVGGEISAVAVTYTDTNPGVVVAVRNASNHLELITFRIQSGGNYVARTDEYEDAAVEKVAIARIGTRTNGDDLVVTACQTLAGNLELISWAIDDNGDITKLDEAQAGGISDVSIARASSRHALTAVVDDESNLKVIAWHVSSLGTITRRTESRGGEAIAVVQEAPKRAWSSEPLMAVTAMADEDRNLKLVVHQVLLTD